MRRRTVAVLAFMLLVGCVSARATMLGTMPQQAPVPSDQVRIFLADDSIPTSCERYALISLSGDASTTNQAQMIAAARTRAGKVGANAVQLAAIDEPGTARVIASAVFGVSADRKGDLVAYRCG